MPADFRDDEPSMRWADDPRTRARLEAAIAALNARLLATASATRALEEWCAGHAGRRTVAIVAEPASGPDLPVPAAVHDELRPADGETIAYRRVRLILDAAVLSEADNWYLPTRLTRDMVRRLDTTDAPFGKIVAALNFTRETLGVERLWQPLDAKPESDGRLEAPPVLFTHRALLRAPDGRAFSEVRESYRRDLLKFVPAA